MHRRFPADDMSEKRFYSTSEVARFCSVHRNTIILAIRKGDLRASNTPGGHNRVAPDDLLAFAREKGIALSGIDVPGPAPARRERPRLLVVDDDPLILEMIDKGLRDIVEVGKASTGYEAGFATLSFRPDLILLDMMLPDIDGGQVYETLRSNQETRNIKILVITAIQDDRTIQRIFGKDLPYLKKPFSYATLRSMVTALLGVEVPS